jgi:hypothetical protein
MKFKGLIPLVYLKFQRLKKKELFPVMKLVSIYQTHILQLSVKTPSNEIGLYLPDSRFAPLCK